MKEQLDSRSIDTLLIAGAVTNICCESSARDAAELNYKVILVSDALSGHAHGLHEATLGVNGVGPRQVYALPGYLPLDGVQKVS